MLSCVLFFETIIQILKNSSNSTIHQLSTGHHIYSPLWTPSEKAMAPHSITLAWKIPGTEEPGRLPSVGLHRVGHDWSDLAAAAWTPFYLLCLIYSLSYKLIIPPELPPGSQHLSSEPLLPLQPHILFTKEPALRHRCYEELLEAWGNPTSMLEP